MRQMEVLMQRHSHFQLFPGTIFVQPDLTTKVREQLFTLEEQVAQLPKLDI